MIITNENYVVDPVVMATDSYRIANGHRLFIDSRPISYRYLEGTFERFDELLDEVNYWLDKANEEGER